ncbi:hypothetical protein [Acetobacter sp. P1H12_c]|uniref:hypothetical protein n=1 Tax=Acetobacter sp. P1H12_c TaxID=2762621 RepID=UPI001C05CCCA|nr:hypothetical protein [Acetobacter sp. P1H12_c]
MVDYTNSDGFVTDAKGRRQYANRDDAALIKGTEIDATDHNEVRNELVYLVSQSGLTPSNDDLTQVYAAVQKLVAAGASEAAVGFTPVEQGGITGLTADKVNIGNSTNGLAAYIAGNYYGVLATQTWANGKFIANSGGTNGGIVSATIDGGTKTPSFQDGSGTWTQVASYSGLQAEISRATTVESNLQSSKANLGGGNTLSGDQVVKGSVSVGVGTGWSGGTSNGQGRWSNGHLVFGAPDGATNTYMGAFQITDLLGSPGDNYSGINMFGYDYAGTRYDWNFAWNGNIKTSKGLVAFESDLSSYVPSSTYASDFSTSDSQVINLAYGNKIQRFVVSVPTNGTNSHRITYPEAFSGAAVPVFNGNDNSQSRSFSLSNNTTPDATGFDIAVSVHGNSTAGSTDAATLTVIAIGPK